MWKWWAHIPIPQLRNSPADRPLSQRICSNFFLKSHLSEYFGDHLANVLSPLWDVWVEAVQVGTEAQRDDLEVIWESDMAVEWLAIITVMVQNSNWIKWSKIKRY